MAEYSSVATAAHHHFHPECPREQEVEGFSRECLPVGPAPVLALTTPLSAHRLRPCLLRLHVDCVDHPSWRRARSSGTPHVGQPPHELISTPQFRCSRTSTRFAICLHTHGTFPTAITLLSPSPPVPCTYIPRIPHQYPHHHLRLSVFFRFLCVCSFGIVRFCVARFLLPHRSS